MSDSKYEYQLSRVRRVSAHTVSARAPPHGTHDGSHLFLRIDRPSAAVGAYPCVFNRAALQHVDVQCAGYGTTHFTGFRFKYVVCPNIDFCEACEAKGVHDPTHNRFKMGSLVSGSNARLNGYSL